MRSSFICNERWFVRNYARSAYFAKTWKKLNLSAVSIRNSAVGNSDATKEHNKSPTDAFILYSSETSILDGTIEAEGESNKGSYSLLLLELQHKNMHSAPREANICENAR